MPQVDDLSIKIKGSSDAVATSVDKVIKKLGALNSSLSNLNTKGLQKFASGMQMLSNSMQGLSSVKLPDYNRVAKGISKFQQIDGKKLAEVSNSLTPLTSAISSLNGIKTDGNITNLVNSLTRLGNSNVANIQNVDFGKLGNSIVDLSNKLQSAQSVSSNTIALTNSIARLGESGATIGFVANNLQPLGQAMVQFTGQMATAPQVSAETIQFTNALGLLAGAGSKTATTAMNLDKLAISLKNFMATMSTAPIIRTDIIQMTDALARLTNQGGRVSLATNNMAKGFHNFANSSKHATKATHNLAYAFGKFYANFWLLIRAFKGIGKMINYASDLTEVQNVVDTTFTNMSYKVDEFAKDSINSFGMSELSVKQYASRFQAMGTAMNISTEKIAKANEYLNKVTQKTNADGMTQSYVGLSDSLSDVSLNLTKLTADMASFYNVEQSDVAKDLESIFTGSTRPMRQYGIDLTEATLKEWALSQGLNANIKAMTQAEKAMLRYQYVMAHTTAAQGDFAKTADTWHNSIVRLKQTLQQIGGTMGQAFINMLKPMVNGLNSILIVVNDFVEKVVNALGVIFGWKIEMQDVGLSDAVDDAGGIADAMGDAADNAKDLKHQLQGFHELNILNSNKGGGSGNGGGGGGGGGGGNNNPIYSIIPTESAFKSDIDTLYKLGEYIGDTLTKALNDIDWESIYMGAINFGKGLADFLNGLISPELFGAVGRTIAGSLNTALYFLNSFGETFDWKDFGLSIATGINNFFSTFDFKTLAHTLNVWANGILDAALEAVKNTDFKEIGKAIGTFISDLDLPDLAIKFADLALQIIKGIGEAILNISAESPIGGAIITVIAGLKLVGAVNRWKTTIGATILNNLGLSVAQAQMTQANANAIGENTGKGMISSVASWLGQDVAKAGMKNILLAAFTGLEVGNIIGGFVNREIATVFRELDKEDWASYYEEYGSPFKALLGMWRQSKDSDNYIQEVVTAFRQLRRDVKEELGLTEADSRKHYSEMNTIHGGGGSQLVITNQGILKTISKLYSDTSDENSKMTKLMYEKLLGISKDGGSDLVKESNNTNTSVQREFSDMADRATGSGLYMFRSMNDIWGSLRTDANLNTMFMSSDVQNNFSYMANASVGSGLYLFSSMGSVWGSLREQASTGGAEVANAGSTAFSNLASGILGQAGSLNNAVATVINGAKSTVEGKADGFKSAGKGLIDGISAGIGVGWSNLKAYLLNLAANLSQSLRNAFGLSGGGKNATPPTVQGMMGDGIVFSTNYTVSFDRNNSSFADDIINGNNNDLSISRLESLLYQQNDLLMQLLEKDVSIASNDIYNAVKTQNKTYYNQTGINGLVY